MKTRVYFLQGSKRVALAVFCVTALLPTVRVQTFTETAEQHQPLLSKII